MLGYLGQNIAVPQNQVLVVSVLVLGASVLGVDHPVPYGQLLGIRVPSSETRPGPTAITSPS